MVVLFDLNLMSKIDLGKPLVIYIYIYSFLTVLPAGIISFTKNNLERILSTLHYSIYIILSANKITYTKLLLLRKHLKTHL